MSYKELHKDCPVGVKLSHAQTDKHDKGNRKDSQLLYKHTSSLKHTTCTKVYPKVSSHQQDWEWQVVQLPACRCHSTATIWVSLL